MGYLQPTADFRQRNSPQIHIFGDTYEPSNAAATSSVQVQTASSRTPQLHQQSGLHGYSTGSMPAIGGMTTQTTPVGIDEECPAAAGLDEAYVSYQSKLNEIFQNVRDGVLATASNSLLAASRWLLSHVVELGMFFSSFPNRIEHG
jgi:hypothetical protein